jgi:hypothetical protein
MNVCKSGGYILLPELFAAIIPLIRCEDARISVLHFSSRIL